MKAPVSQVAPRGSPQTACISVPHSKPMKFRTGISPSTPRKTSDRRQSSADHLLQRAPPHPGNPDTHRSKQRRNTAFPILRRHQPILPENMTHLISSCKSVATLCSKHGDIAGGKYRRRKHRGLLRVALGLGDRGSKCWRWTVGGGGPSGTHSSAGMYWMGNRMALTRAWDCYHQPGGS